MKSASHTPGPKLYPSDPGRTLSPKLEYFPPLSPSILEESTLKQVFQLRSWTQGPRNVPGQVGSAEPPVAPALTP